MARVLVVDDDRDVREALARGLRLAGHEAIQAEHGLNALRLLGVTDDVHVIVTDMQMPVMTGPEFLIERARDPKLAAIPVIVHSGVSFPDMVQGYPQLRKPYPIKDLLALIDQAVAKKPALV